MVAVALGAMTACAVEAEIAGFRLGQRLEVTNNEVCASNGLHSCVHVTNRQTGFSYYQCESFRPIAGYEDVLLYTTTNLVVSGIEAVMKCDSKAKMEEMAKRLADKLSGDYNPPVASTVSSNDLKVVVFDADFKRKM